MSHRADLPIAGGPVSRRAPSQLKGGAIRDLLLYYEDRHGKAYAAAAAAGLSVADATLVWPDRHAMGLLPNLWYPSHVAHKILDAIAMRHSDADVDVLIQEGSDFVVRRLAKGVYQLLFRLVASPELYAKHIQSAWNQLHSTGKRKVEIIEPGYLESSIFDWPGHHRLLCRAVNHTSRALFVAMGYRHVELLQDKCVSRGDPWCKNAIRYRLE